MTEFTDKAYQSCMARVRELDRDRYLAILLSDENLQPHLAALYAFNCELNQVPFVVKERMAGEIRLQWWRDALSGNGHGDVDANPYAHALRQSVARFDLPVSSFNSILNGCSLELEGAFLADVNELEGYLGERVSMLFQLAALCTGARIDHDLATAAGHAGVAYGLTSLLESIPMDIAAGRCYLPVDLCKAHGMTAEAFMNRQIDEHRAMACLADCLALARDHLVKAEQGVSCLPETMRQVFLPLALVSLRLKMVERGIKMPFSPNDKPSMLRRQWTLWRNSGKY